MTTEMIPANQILLPLPELVTQINAQHTECERAAHSALVHAMEAGRLLEQAKGQVEHGGWQAWVQENCAFSLRTAQAYMRVARNAGALEGKAQRAAHLSLREGLALLAEPQDPSRRLDAARAELERLRELTTLLDPDVLTENTPEADGVTDRFLALAEEGLAGLEAECGDDLAALSVVVTKASEWQRLCAEFVLRTGRAAGALLPAAEKDAQVAVGGAP